MNIRHLRGAAGLLAVTVLAAACAKSGSSSGSSPGITATTVTIGSHQPLTGPAAPGYSEIAPASNAYFQFVNDHGGVNGRKIVYRYLDDGYNPATTVDDVRRLVLQDKVFAIFNGLGTPTHTKVVDFLTAQKVPDLFVASGCLCWDQPTQSPETFGWQPDYTVEGKILGQYVAQHYAGMKVGYFTQADDFGQDGIKGLDQYIPAANVVSRQTYQPGNINVAPQVVALQRAGAQIVVAFTIPAYTALLRLVSLKVGFSPQLVVTNVGSDPTTVGGLVEAFAKKGGVTVKGGPLIQGIVTDGYLPPTGAATNSWITLFQQVHDKYISTLPFDGNVEYGMAAAYTFVQALKAAGKNPTRASLVAAVEAGGFTGPGLVPFRYSATSHAGYTGTQIGTIVNGNVVLAGTPLTTDDGSGAITPYTGIQPTAPSDGIPPG